MSDRQGRADGEHPGSELEFFRYFVAAYPRRTMLMIGLLTVAGLLEGISVVTLVPLLDVAAGDAAPVSGPGALIRSALAAIGIPATLGYLLAIIVAAVSAKAVFMWLAMRQVGYTVAQVALDLRLDLVKALMRARWSYFDQQQIGQFANAVSAEALRASSAYREACVVLAGLLQVIAYLIVSALISWQVTLAAAVTGTVLVTALRRLVRLSRAAGQQQTALTKSLTGRLVESIQGIKPVKAMGREVLFWPLLEDEARGLNTAHRRQVVASESLKLVQEPLVTLVLGLGLVALLTFTDRSFSSIIVLAFLFYRLMTHARTIQMQYQIMATGESAFWSLREQTTRAQAEAEDHPGRRPVSGLRDLLELRDVSFSYGEHVVLRNAHLRINAGSFVAIVGASGSGKTSILDLILGLRRPDEGDVYIDGVSLAELDIVAWRHLIGYVPQQVFLFHDTVRRNVTLGDQSITDTQVETALKDAGAWDFVTRDRLGIDAMIAPQASNLSGGQRQRLAIARALVKQPSLLVLDEATTGLDVSTEAAIAETLRQLAGKVTILAISHQPILQESADLTIRLTPAEDGVRISAVERAGGLTV